ncbi:aspartate ammonia-lyase [Dorea sp.]
MRTRTEADSIGVMEVPAEAYYGVQALRAKENFPITHQQLHPEFIKSMAKLKKAAAITNRDAGLLPLNIASAIMKACDELIAGKYTDSFIVDAIQGGAGTSANMNANEVIANRAIEILGGTKGDYSIVHPNDHVNMAQSTNDIIPSAGKLTAITLLTGAIKELERLYEALMDKAEEFDSVLKMGRTQLQDAVPMRLGQSFHAYASVLHRDILRLEDAIHTLEMLNMGGTAIGSSINVSPLYLKNICKNLNKITKGNFYLADDLFDATQNLDGFVSVSGVLKTCAVNLSKMCNDLRLLSSGPKTGIGEINLPARQNGSSIMPGKINPVIPEVVSQVAFNIIGHDYTITMAAEAGQLELNAFEPVIFYTLFESIETLGHAAQTLTDNCILGITANEKHCKDLVNASAGIATALCPSIGYTASAALAKKSLKMNVPVRELAIKEGYVTEEEADRLLDPYTMTGKAFERTYYEHSAFTNDNLRPVYQKCTV